MASTVLGQICTNNPCDVLHIAKWEGRTVWEGGKGRAQTLGQNIESTRRKPAIIFPSFWTQTAIYYHHPISAIGATLSESSKGD
jgi:hypothetical protein